MFTKISSLILAILVFLMFFGSAANLYVFAASLAVLIFASLAVNFKRLNFTWPHLMLPLIYLVAAGSAFLVVDEMLDGNRIYRIIFLLIIAAIFYLLEIKLGKESHFLQNVYLLSVFAIFLAMFAFQFYFVINIWIMVPLSFIIIYLLAIQGFAGFSLPSKKYFHLLIAITGTEVVWGLSFWPTHFLVNAIILFIFFYLLWLFSFSAFFGKLTRQKVYWQLTLITIVLIIILSTANWRL